MMIVMLKEQNIYGNLKGTYYLHAMVADKDANLPIFYYYLDEKRYSQVGSIDPQNSKTIQNGLANIVGETNVVLQ